MRYILKLLTILFTILFTIGSLPVLAGDSTNVSPMGKVESTSYRIDVPGTITFTVGVKIKGKVEKPQVIIFLPKEKSFYRDLEFTYSFEKEISKPLPFVPIIE